MNEHNKTETVINTENKQVVARGEGHEGKKEIGEGDGELTNFQLQDK